MWWSSQSPKQLKLTISDRTVPQFQMYYPSVSVMDETQRKFYEHWKSELRNGRALDVGDNISYIFCYCYEVHESNDFKFIYEQLRYIETVYKEREKIFTYCRDWAIDALIGLGDLKRALVEFSDLPLNTSGSLRTDVLLSLKRHLGERISGKDVLTLNGPKVTKYAREHLDAVARFVDTIIEGQEANTGNILNNWISSYGIWKGPHHMFNGSPAGRTTKNLEVFAFSRTSEILNFCRDLTREAENTFREERGMPRVGEGWISETELYYKIKNAFQNLTVVQHARPDWLGRQHLDIYIEKACIAVEYQGSQHSTPIAYFGGEEAFRQTQERDKRKHRLCKKHGVELIYVEEGYSFEAITTRIRTAVNRHNDFNSNN